MKSSTQYKVEALKLALAMQRPSFVVIRGDTNTWRVDAVEEVKNHAVVLRVFDSQLLIVDPEDILSVRYQTLLPPDSVS